MNSRRPYSVFRLALVTSWALMSASPAATAPPPRLAPSLAVAPAGEPGERLAVAGRFELRTIRPGGYPRALRLGDRARHIPPHIHLDVDASGHPGHRFQVVFADDSLLTDPYWRDWVRKLGQPILRATREGGLWHAELTLVLD